MASENIIIEPVLDASTDAAAHNAEIARKLAAQDAAGNSTVAKPEDISDAMSALDKLAETQAREKEKEIDPPDPEVKPTPEVTPEEKTKADEAAAKVAADAKADLERAETFFKDAPKLPPNASPKSSEAFQSIKIRAAKDISERDAEIEKLRKEVAERDEKLKNPLPPETEKEIKELREWRAKLDVEADPKFNEFNKTIEQTREFIYSQLSQNPNVNAPELIAAIKKAGGAEMVKWDKIFAGLQDPTLQRIIESKISDIEMAKFNKAQAIKASKDNVQGYLAERTKQFETARKEHNETTQKHLANYIDKSLTWMREKPVDPKADAATKKAVEDHNAFVAQLQGELIGALNDDTPEVRAMMIAGMAQLVYVQKLHDADKKAWEADKKELAETKATLAKIKGASVSRMRETAAPGDKPAPVKTDDQKLFNTPATQALDDLMKDMMQKRAQAAAA